ncbi:MAG: hypothetical protein GF411_13795 [Candidatus Lokiarchaeota archaeon]|nr:hypothetical protein [Candidatus Lokiarchaeota archaeon]
MHKNSNANMTPFDFDSRKCRPAKYKLRDTSHFGFEDSRSLMLDILQIFCLSCRMCELGKSMLEEKGKKLDPHVFSNMQHDAKFMVVGQNPGFNECVRGVPFIGAAGQNFDDELDANGLSRDKLYITNIVKCKTPGNKFDSRHSKYKQICSAILKLEIQVIKPKMIITLGSHAFSFFAPDKRMSNHLGDIVWTDWGPIFPIYHPSPMNLADKSRKDKFKKDIRIMCKVVRKLLSN